MVPRDARTAGLIAYEVGVNRHVAMFAVSLHGDFDDIRAAGHDLAIVDSHEVTAMSLHQLRQQTIEGLALPLPLLATWEGAIWRPWRQVQHRWRKYLRLDHFITE